MLNLTQARKRVNETNMLVVPVFGVSDNRSSSMGLSLAVQVQRASNAR